MMPFDKSDEKTKYGPPQPASMRPGMDEDTIAAIATGVGRAGIGVIRLSGRTSLKIGRLLFRPLEHKGLFSNGSVRAIKPHSLTYGHIIDPREDRLIDEVLVTYMPAPKSYTREDVVEIQCHGGAAVMKTILTLVLHSGARLAEPGEFTRRAFLNGRIDLSQAEAISDIICASSDSALRAAAKQLEGGLKRRVEELVALINDVSAEIEARIEFPDDVEESYNDQMISSLLGGIITHVKRLEESYTYGRKMRDGVRIAIAGRPNVGKSSLLNALIEEEKAIVTSVPGTTRDPVEAAAIYKGVEVMIIDTAGIHASCDPVESIGIQKGKEVIADADLVLMMVDATRPDELSDFELFEYCRRRPVILVANKIDLVVNPDHTCIPRKLAHVPHVFVSALQHTGIGALKEMIYNQCVGEWAGANNDAIITDVRHKECLSEALQNLQNAHEGIQSSLPDDFIAIELNLACQAMERVIGKKCDHDVIDRIFERFCIGK